MFSFIFLNFTGFEAWDGKKLFRQQIYHFTKLSLDLNYTKCITNSRMQVCYGRILQLTSLLSPLTERVAKRSENTFIINTRLKHEIMLMLKQKN